MARELYPGTLVQQVNGDAAPNTPFTLWDDAASGNNITASVVSADGITTYSAVTNAQGLLLPFRGPDNYQGPVFVDTGVGQRAMLLSSTVQAWLVSAVANLILNGTGSGGGLPAGTTLDQIPNGTTRIAFTQAWADKLQTIAAGATNTPIGVVDATTGLAPLGTAKPGNWMPTPTQIGSPRNVAGFNRVWGRTAAQGLPTVAEGLATGDYAALDAT